MYYNFNKILNVVEITIQEFNWRFD